LQQWFSAPSFWMGGGLESRCVGCVYGTDGAVHGTTHPKARCRKPYAATQHLMLLMMGYVPETCRAKNTSIKLPSCIKLAFHFISLEFFVCLSRYNASHPRRRTIRNSSVPVYQTTEAEDRNLNTRCRGHI